MCGRVTLSMEWDRLAFILSHDYDMEALPKDPEYRPDYNIAPGRELISLIANPKSGRIRAGLMNWTYVPFARKTKEGDRPFTLINARAETLDSKPSFADSFRKRPCLVPVEGFFEWQKKDGDKLPYHFRPTDDGLLYLAGLYTKMPDSLLTPEMNPFGFLIITTEANELMRPIHDRMPVLLTPEQANTWLDITRSPEERKALLAPAPAQALLRFRVDARVNSAKAEGPDCIKPLNQ